MECECRYRFPRPRQNATKIQNAGDNKVKWYSWDGSYTERHTKELILKRDAYDVFQNQSCPAIGLSKLLPHNTNLNMIFQGRTGQYSFKYNFKNTQQDDRALFDAITEVRDKMFARLPQSNSESRTERSEATRRLLLASFAQQKANIVGGSMSSYLTRNKERFIFSHEMIWVPLRDLIALLGGQKTTSNSIRFNGRVPYFVNAALHYLARPDELEQVTVFDFYSKYDVVRVTSRNREAVFQFSKTASFTHPSYKPSTGRFLQGVLERNGRKRLPQVFQYDFPDPAEFCGHLLHSR